MKPCSPLGQCGGALKLPQELYPPHCLLPGVELLPLEDLLHHHVKVGEGCGMKYVLMVVLLKVEVLWGTLVRVLGMDWVLVTKAHG